MSLGSPNRKRVSYTTLTRVKALTAPLTCCPVSATGVIKLRLGTADRFINFAIAEDLLPLYPGSNWQTRQHFAIPRAPSALGDLFGISNCVLTIHVYQHQIGIVAAFNATFTNQVPDASGSVAHPMYDLFNRAAAFVDLIQHQGQ